MNENMNWYLGPIKNHYADFAGRARRKEFWMFVLFNTLVSVVLVAILGMIKLDFLAPIYSLLMLLPGLALTARRLHDVGKSGWFMLISLIPIVGLYLIYLLAQDGEAGSNAYGPNPKSKI
jgi:uncharacterized membrane protein YhaH (DUF805 family)